jgi:hypothetical protein
MLRNNAQKLPALATQGTGAPKQRQKTDCPSHTGNWCKKSKPKKPMGYHSSLNDKQSKTRRSGFQGQKAERKKARRSGLQGLGARAPRVYP